MSDGTIYRVSVDIRADGTSAVRGIRQVATESEKSSKTVQKDNEESAASFDRVGRSTERLRGAIGSLAGTLGFTGLAFGLKDVVQAGMQWQQQVSQMGGALRSVGIYSKQTMSDLTGAADTLATHGGFAAPQQMQALTNFVRLTGNATKAIQANKAATELARGAGIGYSQGQRMVQMALAGTTGRLQRYLGIIQPVKTAEYALTQAHGLQGAALMAASKAMGSAGGAWLKAQEVLHGITPAEQQHAQLLDRQATATMVLQRIQEKFGSATQRYSNTAAGALSNLRNSFEGVARTVGMALLPIISTLAAFLAHNRVVVFALIAAVGALGAMWAAIHIVNVIRDFKELAVVQKLSTLWSTLQTKGFAGLRDVLIGTTVAEDGTAASAGVLAVAMNAIPLLGLITLLVLMVTHLKETGKIIVTVFQALWSAVKRAGVFIGGVFKEIGTVVGSVVRFIEHLFAALWGAITWPFREAWKVIKTIFDAITSAAQSVARFVGKVFGAILSPFKAVGNFIGGVAGSIGSFLGLHTGGPVTHRAVLEHRTLGSQVVRHLAWGGPLGGYGGGDTIPLMGEPGEYMLRKEAVQQIGIGRLNSLNQTGSLAGPGGGEQVMLVTMPVSLTMGSRVVAEETVHFAAKKSALSGSYAPA